MTWEVAAEILPAALPILVGCGIFSIICAGLIVKSRLNGVWGNHIDPMPSKHPPSVSDLFSLKGWRARQHIGQSITGANKQLATSASEHNLAVSRREKIDA
jgi:hypothetical protein